MDFQVLPEAIKKTIRIKESLKNGRVKTINEAIICDEYKQECLL